MFLVFFVNILFLNGVACVKVRCSMTEAVFLESDGEDIDSFSQLSEVTSSDGILSMEAGSLPEVWERLRDTLRCCLSCPLCHSALVGDAVVLQTCGHIFCEACINFAIEKGFEETSELAVVRSALNCSVSALKHKSRRKMDFTCPVCMGPAHKWMLTPIHLVPAFCRVIQGAVPLVFGEERAVSTSVTIDENREVSRCRSGERGLGDAPESDVKVKSNDAEASVELFIQPDVGSSVNALYSNHDQPQHHNWPLVDGQGEDEQLLGADLAYFSSVDRFADQRSSAPAPPVHAESQCNQGERVPQWTEGHQHSPETNSVASRKRSHSSLRDNESPPPRRCIASQPAAVTRIVLLDYSCREGTVSLGTLKRLLEAGFTVVDERRSLSLTLLHHDGIGDALTSETAEHLILPVRYVMLAPESLSCHIVLGEFAWVPEDSETPRDGCGFWCVNALTPVICTALVQGAKCLNTTWIALDGPMNSLDADETAWVAHAPRTWKRLGKMRSANDPNNVFACLYRSQSLKNVGDACCRSGKWISEERCGFVFLPESWLKQTLSLLSCGWEQADTQCVCARIQEWEKRNAIQWDARGTSTSGFSKASWQRLIISAGGIVVDIPHLLWKCILVYSLTKPFSLAKIPHVDQPDFNSKIDSFVRAMGNSIAGELRDIAHALCCGEAEVAPASLEVQVMLPQKTCYALWVVRNLLVLHSPITERFLSEACDFGGSAVRSASELRELFGNVMISVSKCLYVLSYAATLCLGSGEADPVHSHLIEARTASWLLSNLAEGRDEPGVKAAPGLQGMNLVTSSHSRNKSGDAVEGMLPAASARLAGVHLSSGSFVADEVSQPVREESDCSLRSTDSPPVLRSLLYDDSSDSEEGVQR